ncbi:winged helix DNA-binding protein [Qipengyuania sp.]|uniref:winged helix DNA-binding protein n=1 Tax=Qipengyuania sp. TaxID=2004515 RepID=UPI0035C860C6
MGQLAYAFDDRGGVLTSAGGEMAPTVSLLGEGRALERMKADVARAGVSVRNAGPLAGLLGETAVPLGEVVMVECRQVSGASLAALVRLDARAARAGAEVLAFTSEEALEDVFGCLASARVQYLLDAFPAERLAALGAALGQVPGSRVREMDEEERLALLRLTQEVSRLASKVDRLDPAYGTKLSHDSHSRSAFPDLAGDTSSRGERHARPSLPDPRLVQQIIRQRRLRGRYFKPDLFADPAWDILLDLTAARAEHRRVSVSSLCIAAAVPPTTGLRWIAQMTEAGLLVREQDDRDRRRAFLTLSDWAAEAMAQYFDALGKDALKMI